MRREADFVLEKAAWPTLLLEAGGRICRANQAARRVFGLAGDLSVKSLAAIWGDKNAASADKFLLEQSEDATSQVNLQLHDGAKAQFIAHVATVARDGQDYFLLQLFKESGAALAGPPPKSSTTKTDKDHIKAAEEKETPAATEEEFLLQNAEWPVLLLHRTGKILRANRAAVRAFGASVGEAEAQLEAIWSPHNRDTCQQFLNMPPPAEPVPLKFHLKSGLPGDFLGQFCGTGYEEVFVLQLINAPAPEAPRTTESKPPPETAPAPPSSPGDDTTVRTAAEANLAHKQKLDCALQLARSVALDFNNALTSILGHTSLLLSKVEAGNPWRTSLVEIEKSAAKAAEIANDLAAFSRQEKDVRVQVAGNLNTLLERTVEMFRGSMQSSITITQQLERKLFTANFDEAKMQQALVKIFENAVESIKGSGKINVQTRNLELAEASQDRTARLNAGNYVCVEISDTGSGIAEDVMPRIFEPFFSTKGARHRGLGLAWVYGIVTNHGGGVAVSSQVDVGTAVRIYLPASRKIVRDTPAADGDLTGTQTILFVDDEDLLLTMARTVLSSYGYTVLTANSGQKALELFNRSKDKISLVITDLVMPNMSGRELTEHLVRAAPGTRVIWSSGYVRSASEQEQERYLQKPFSAQDLLRKVKHVLAQ